MKDAEIKKSVREGYAKIAKEERSCCSPASSCCGNASLVQSISKAIGYTDEDIVSVPKGANLGLGCGNPVAMASLVEGEIVLDLGSGAGFDCFLAAGRVGSEGKVIGVDMTPEMIENARENAQKGNYKNVEFRLGEIENLPAADNSVDIVISNCVINLSPDKNRVFRDTFRVLKPGGRLMVSDIVLLKELPGFIKDSVEAYIGCVAGAILKDEYIKTVEDAGFAEVKIIDQAVFPIDYIISDPTAKAIIEKLKVPAETIENFADSIASIKIQAMKPN